VVIHASTSNIDNCNEDRPALGWCKEEAWREETERLTSGFHSLL
jgi:hypothetical protein